jgi:7-cyano-7-deazaguanine reductase
MSSDRVPGGLPTALGDLTKMASLETFPNQFPDRDYEVEITCPEFTAVCPKTGQPDFGTIIINYVPGRSVIELKSLKLYLFAFRDRGIFYEHSINTILDDLVAACQPRKMRVIGQFTPRGGISSKITARYESTALPPEAEELIRIA